MFGIDVSVNQGVVNWGKAKASGVDFAMIKASQGRAVTSSAYLFTDSRFAANIKGATAVGMPVGVYHYLTAKTVAEANKEADYFLSVIAPYRGKITLWAAVDVEEDRYLPISNRWLLTTIVDAFVVRVRAAGYKAMIYTNRSYMTQYLDMSGLRYIDIWQAHWSKTKPDDCGNDLKIWQHEVRGSAADVSARPQRATVVGSVPGVTGAIDCNYGYFTLPSTTAQKPIESIAAGSKVKILPNAKYTTGAAVPSRLIGSVQTVTSINSAGVYIAAIYSRIKLEGLQLV